MVEQFRQLYKDIVSLESFQPSLLVDKFFSELVRGVIGSGEKHDLNVWEINALQRACNLAEVELEKYWVRRIISSPDPKEEVEKFPYINNYRELTRMELSMLEMNGAIDPRQPIVFVGGGLPLSSYVLAKDHGISSVVLDNDGEAVGLAQEFVRKVGMGQMMEIVEASGQSFNGYGKIVIVAALAGVEDGLKRDIFRQIPRSSTILARSVEEDSNRELLYKPLPGCVLEERKLAVLVHPSRTKRYREVINSAFILEAA